MNSFNALVDFHSHIIPGADHGSGSTETSAEQMKFLYGAGVRYIVATPHFYPNADSVATFLNRREECEKILARISVPADLRVYVGAEVLVCGGMQNMDGLEKLCIRGTNVLLLEMPFTKWKEELFETVYEISLRKDLRVVLAHVGRYPSVYIDRLLDECNVSVQLNGETVGDRHAKKRALERLSQGVVSAFGSDIHGPDKKAAEHLSELYSLAGERATDVLSAEYRMLEGAVPVSFGEYI